MSHVIIGGGIIGLSTCYNLLLNQQSTVLIENSTNGVASAASGKAGGFLSRDWHNEPTKSLAILAFEEHKRLAAQNDGENTYGFRYVSAIGTRIGLSDDVSRSAYRILPEGVKSEGESWINGEREDMSGSDESLAQL